MDKLKVPLPVIVEGRYDKIKLSSIIEGDIIATDGFGVFNDRDKLSLIRALAAKGPVVVLTDSDRAGFRIRGFLNGALPPGSIIHVYIPQLYGRERRKLKPSAEGTLGVEGMPADILRRALIEAGVPTDAALPRSGGISKAELYRLGLSGRDNSAARRRLLLERLKLPRGLSSNALPALLDRIMTLEELEALSDGLDMPPEQL